MFLINFQEMINWPWKAKFACYHYTTTTTVTVTTTTKTTASVASTTKAEDTELNIWGYDQGKVELNQNILCAYRLTKGHAIFLEWLTISRWKFQSIMKGMFNLPKANMWMLLLLLILLLLIIIQHINCYYWFYYYHYYYGTSTTKAKCM